MKNNRVIKFRFWNSFNRIMNYPSIEYKDHLSKFFIEHDLALGGENNPILMQFCGLHDKNGKEIFEGDIVLYVGENYSSNTPQIIVNRIGYEFSCEDSIDKELGDLYGFTLEIIGNIYENPELLTTSIPESKINN